MGLRARPHNPERRFSSSALRSLAGYHGALVVARSKRGYSILNQQKCLQVAASVPASMEAVGLAVAPRTLDLVLGAFTSGRRIHRSVDLLHTLYTKHGLAPGAGGGGLPTDARPACLSCRVRSVALAEQTLAQMRELGMAATVEQRQVPRRIDHVRQLRATAAERRRLQPPSDMPSEFSLSPTPLPRISSSTPTARTAGGLPRGGPGAGSPARRPSLPRGT